MPSTVPSRSLISIVSGVTLSSKQSLLEYGLLLRVCRSRLTNFSLSLVFTSLVIEKSNLSYSKSFFKSESSFLIPASVVTHCVKSVQMQSFFWSVFFCIQSEYRKIWTRENFVFGNFSRSVKFTLTIRSKADDQDYLCAVFWVQKVTGSDMMMNKTNFSYLLQAASVLYLQKHPHADCSLVERRLS